MWYLVRMQERALVSANEVPRKELGQQRLPIPACPAAMPCLHLSTHVTARVPAKTYLVTQLHIMMLYSEIA